MHPTLSLHALSKDRQSHPSARYPWHRLWSVLSAWPETSSPLGRPPGPGSSASVRRPLLGPRLPQVSWQVPRRKPRPTHGACQRYHPLPTSGPSGRARPDSPLPRVIGDVDPAADKRVLPQMRQVVRTYTERSSRVRRVRRVHRLSGVTSRPLRPSHLARASKFIMMGTERATIASSRSEGNQTEGSFAAVETTASGHATLQVLSLSHVLELIQRGSERNL